VMQGDRSIWRRRGGKGRTRHARRPRGRSGTVKPHCRWCRCHGGAHNQCRSSDHVASAAGNSSAPCGMREEASQCQWLNMVEHPHLGNAS
jgi:hypothetical protein